LGKGRSWVLYNTMFSLSFYRLLQLISTNRFRRNVDIKLVAETEFLIPHIRLLRALTAIKWKPLNVSALGRRESDNINRMITTSNELHMKE
jgi:hypothetical protein